MSRLAQIEFVRLDGQPVRVTSLREDDATGQIDLIVVARGSSAAATLRNLATRRRLALEVPDQFSRDYALVDTDIRTTGTGEQQMNRVHYTLLPNLPTPAPETPADDAHESQLDRIERKLDELLTLMKRQS